MSHLHIYFTLICLCLISNGHNGILAYEQPEYVSRQELQQALQDLEERMTTKIADERLTKIHPRESDPFTVYGCDLHIVQLVCSSGTINITNAYYGQYPVDSCVSCCTPNMANECTESMEQNNPSNWVALNIACNGQSTCEYENYGSQLPSCTSPYDADYLAVEYICSGATDPLYAFSAFPTTDRSYEQYDIVLFDSATTNIGGSYDPSTSIFVCPRTGIYLFSVTAFNSVQSTTTGFRGLITKEGIHYGAPWADREDQGSSTVVFECRQGERVWVESVSYSGLWGSSLPYSSFSGVLIHAY